MNYVHRRACSDHEVFLKDELNLISHQLFFVHFVTFVVNHFVVPGKIFNPLSE
jgi:hypothetical protein